MILVLLASFVSATLLIAFAALLEWLDKTYLDYKLIKRLERWFK